MQETKFIGWMLLPRTARETSEIFGYCGYHPIYRIAVLSRRAFAMGVVAVQAFLAMIGERWER